VDLGCFALAAGIFVKEQSVLDFLCEMLSKRDPRDLGRGKEDTPSKPRSCRVV
jgi:hypothetical protein